MRLPTSISEWLRASLLAGLAALYGWVLLRIQADTPKPFPEHLLPALLSEIQRGSVQLLLLTDVVLGSWVYYLHRLVSPKRTRDRYTLSRTGIRVRKGKNYCNRCIMEDSPVESELYDLGARGDWKCDRCHGEWFDETKADKCFPKK